MWKAPDGSRMGHVATAHQGGVFPVCTTSNTSQMPCNVDNALSGLDGMDVGESRLCLVVEKCHGDGESFAASPRVAVISKVHSAQNPEKQLERRRVCCCRMAQQDCSMLWCIILLETSLA